METVAALADQLHEFVRDNRPALGTAAEPPPTGAPGKLGGELFRWTKAIADQACDHASAANASVEDRRIEREALLALADRVDGYVQAMDFGFLFNRDRNLFTIGINLATGKHDVGSYDLMASEASLTSYVAVARGIVPWRHWYALGRPAVQLGSRVGLVSWSGSMFEFIMPRLLLHPPTGSLLDECHRATVARQIDFARDRGTPWGISESAFAKIGDSGEYEYQAFGVPGLGYKRGLSQDLVIAPYASLLAAPIDWPSVRSNIHRLRKENCEGPFGLFEALDYTPGRTTVRGTPTIVKTFMAHHFGMALLGMTNKLFDNVWCRRFSSAPEMRAAASLLDEPAPTSGAPMREERVSRKNVASAFAAEHLPVQRAFTTSSTRLPATQLLSNGRYSVMLTNAGGGWSRCDNLQLSRWRLDRTCDALGFFVLLHDRDKGKTWGTTPQPIRHEFPVEISFALDRVVFITHADGLDSRLEIVVSSEHAAELRVLRLTNTGAAPRRIEVTACVEPVVGSHDADVAHPAFEKLFIETSFDVERNALLARRRARSPDEPSPVAFLAAIARDRELTIEGETNRFNFIGRGRTLSEAVALDATSLSGQVGPVLDPVLALRTPLVLKPGETIELAFLLGLASDRVRAVDTVDAFADFATIDRELDLASTHAQQELETLSLSLDQAALASRLYGHVLFADPMLRATDRPLPTAAIDRTLLWKHGVSGDCPIVLLEVADEAQIAVAGELAAAFRVWRARNLKIDAVFLARETPELAGALAGLLSDLARSSGYRESGGSVGNIHVLSTLNMEQAEIELIKSVSNVVMAAANGSIAIQLDLADATPLAAPSLLFASAKPATPPRDAVVALPALPPLSFFNGIGGLTADHREYVIDIDGDAKGNRSDTPSPWINVIANPNFGFLVSERGSSCTWSQSSQLNRLTPWTNDPVTDPVCEAIYLRDEQTGAVWTATAGPIREEGLYRVRHGQGYTRFERASHGLEHELTVFVDDEKAVKYWLLKVTNPGKRPRTLSATCYAELTLGTTRDRSQVHVATSWDEATKAIYARQPLVPDFGGRVAFATCHPTPVSWTADRGEFLGRLGSVANPAGMAARNLTGTTGRALDPCVALRTPIDIPAGGARELVFVIGQEANSTNVKALVQQAADIAAAHAALDRVNAMWERLLTAVTIDTPNEAFNALVNRWVLYQAISCRMWGRTAFYQSSGAFGYRDQLQDSLSVLLADPARTRSQIVLCASRQFEAGDVQHWWHPSNGAGVRTRCSDDMLWLPYAVCAYVKTTGDTAILDEVVPFLDDRELAPDELEEYGVPKPTATTATVYEHARRAIERGDTQGPHRIPLMGTGDWNDGMNRVGHLGKGESTFNGWFLGLVLQEFAQLADTRGDGALAARYLEERERIREALETHAWDGAWYLRGYYDDGQVLGSHTRDECRIDSLAQSWGVISGMADPERARTAIASVREHLVRTASRQALLFDPPFDDGVQQPGYIKGYLPGVRENGGQYTHAATWLVLALTKLGRGDEAMGVYDLLNPLLRVTDQAAAETYRVEPFAIPGDVYGGPLTGRGGWTWYTGAAGWMYRVAIEGIVGMRVEGDRLFLQPCIPQGWPGFGLRYRRGTCMYEIEVKRTNAGSSILVDGIEQTEPGIPLVATGGVCRVVVSLADRPESS